MQIFNLTNSLLGGGTLSIPFVFAKCGIFGAVLLILFSMTVSIFSLELLCQMSKKLGCSSYSEVIERTLGRQAKQTATYCLVVILFLAIIAYLVLLRDVASELFMYFTPATYELTSQMENMIITSLVVMAYPLMTANSLHALRHTSYCGTSCIILLLGCLCCKAIGKVAEFGIPAELIYVPATLSDFLTALPITLIAYLCHFNVNGVYCDLQKPEEINFVIRTAVSGASIVFILFGMAGYIFAGGETADNILKNFSPRDPLLMVARLGLSITLMTQLPMMIIPCRKTIYPLLWPETNKVEATVKRRASHQSDAHLAKILSSPDHQPHVRSFSMDMTPGPVLEVEEGYGVKLDGDAIRYGLTLLLISVLLMISQSVPGVFVVWTVAGSTLTIIICHLLPSAAYITAWKSLGPSRSADSDVLACYVLFGVGIAAMMVCTPQAVCNAFTSPEN